MGSSRKGRGTRGRQKSSRYEQVAVTPAMLASLLKHFPTQNQPSQSCRELPGFLGCSPGARTPKGPRRIPAAQSPPTHTQSCNSCIQSGARNRLPPCPTAGWEPAGTALCSAGPTASSARFVTKTKLRIQQKLSSTKGEVWKDELRSHRAPPCPHAHTDTLDAPAAP